MSSPSKAYALVEDKRHRQFIYRFLILAGINRNNITIEISPAGHGSAKQWVCRKFPQQVELCRKRNAKASTCLFIMMDTDQSPMEKCMGDLDASLAAVSKPRIDPTRDPVARLFPKWSIETWILYLSADGAPTPAVDEDMPYKNAKTRDQWSELIPHASRTFFEWTKPAAALPTDLLKSLQHGIKEVPCALPAGR